jgi:oligosaccharide translocation protein RFT1
VHFPRRIWVEVADLPSWHTDFCRRQSEVIRAAMAPPPVDGGAALALGGFLRLLLSQVATRLLTFALNLATARALSPAAYGVAVVQFHLLNTGILFLAREGLRRACLRVAPGEPAAARRVLGTAALAAPAGGALAAAAVAALARIGAGGDPAYLAALRVQGAAALVELLAEPLYILATVERRYGLRLAAEAAATLGRAAVTLGALRRGAPPPLAFSWGQLAYAAALLAVYSAYWARVWALRRAVSKRGGRGPAAAAAATDSGWPRLDRGVLRVAGAFSVQAAGKLALAEGSKAVLAAAAPADVQGVYGLVANLGSLAARVVFQPYEEAAFAAFSRGAGGRAPAALRARAALLALLCRGAALAGGAAAAFGPAYAHLAIAVLYGPRWAASGAAPALGAYSLYLALLAANGTLEAFVHAVASPAELAAANGALGAASVAHLALCAAGVAHGGALGLLLADAANMAARIAYCLRFAARHFAGAPGGAVYSARGLAPGRATLAALAGAAAVTGASRVLLLPESSAAAAALAARWPKGPAAALARAAVAAAPEAARAVAHVGVGCVCLVAVAAAARVGERDVLAELRRLRAGKAA